MGPPAPARDLTAWISRRQQTLLRLLKGEERARIGPMSPGLRSYRQRFLMEFRTTSPIPRPMSAVEDAVSGADLVFSGDYHAHPRPENTHLRWLQLMVRPGRRVALALEMVSSRHQRALDDLAAGRLTADRFRRRIRFDSDWGFPWRPYAKLLRRAIRCGCRLIALDHPGRSDGASVNSRDRHAADLLSGHLARRNEPLLVVAGEMHLATPHLPARTVRALEARNLSRRMVTVFHGHEDLYFSAGAAVDPETCAALDLGGNRFCVLQSAPWVRLLAHLHWLEGRQMDPAAGPEEKVVDWTARTMALLAGVRPPGRHAAEEEIGTTGTTAPCRIARRAVARLEEGRARLPLHQPGRRALWVTLGRCLVDPPASRPRGRAPRGVSAAGLDLYRRLMSGKVGLGTLRDALWGEPTSSRAAGVPDQLPERRSRTQASSSES